MSLKPLKDSLNTVQSRAARTSNDEGFEKDTENFIAGMEQGGSNIMVMYI